LKTTTTVLPIFSINNRKDRINPKPQYQRGAVWTIEKKQLLIDTIIRGYDIPKFYLRVLKEQDYEHEVVDGQQRLRAIWSFLANEFSLGDESIGFESSEDLVGKYYTDLDSDLQDNIGSFSLSITYLDEASDLEIRELFLRLQEGSTLSPPEKRNAMIGKMRDFVHELSTYPILLKTTVSNNRFQHDDYVAHVCKLEVSSGPSDVKASDLKTFYESEAAFDLGSKTAKTIKQNLKYLNKAFANNTPELRVKWGFVDLYLLVSSLRKSFVMKDREVDVFEFFIGFEGERKNVSDPADLLASHSPWSKDLYDYIMAFQRDGAKRASLEVRHQVYEKKFMNDYPDLIPKDSKRAFSSIEREVIWRRAGMKCENPKCNLDVELNNMHADHILPHSKGGLTTIENGQCLCVTCNLQKSAN
jgi:hypothetical protein